MKGSGDGDEKGGEDGGEDGGEEDWKEGEMEGSEDSSEEGGNEEEKETEQKSEEENMTVVDIRKNEEKRGIIALLMGMAERLQREITRMNGARVEQFGRTMSTNSEVRLRTTLKPVNDEVLVAVIGFTGSSMSYFCHRATGYDDNGVNEKHEPCMHISNHPVNTFPDTQPPTMYHLMVPTVDGEKHVTPVNTSGFMVNTTSQNKTTIPDGTNDLHRDCVPARKFSGILFLHRISLMKEPEDSPLFTQFKMFSDLYNIAVLDQIFVVDDPWDYLMKAQVGIWRQRELQELGCQVGGGLRAPPNLRWSCSIWSRAHNKHP
jgi:hypothetical protein